MENAEKKKIAVVFNRMIVGGAEKSLMNFLNALDKEKYDVTFFTFNDKGAYFDQLPKNVTVEFTECKNVNEYLLDNIRHFKLIKAAKAIFFRLMIHLSRDPYMRMIHTARCYPRFSGKYDCAISYKFNYEDSVTTLIRLNADKKCTWIHSYPIDLKNQSSAEYRFYKFITIAGDLFQRIFTVSAEVKKWFDQLYPSMQNKTQVFYNLIDPDEISKKAEQEINDVDLNDYVFKVVTVGRLHNEKGQMLIPQTTKLLLDEGYKIKWYIIGDGSLRQQLEQEIEKLGIQNEVVLLGTKDNPYPYMNACDVYVQTSYTEGFGLTVAEAKILHKPIVTTDAGVMSEQITNGENGIIVPEATSEALFEGIKMLLDNPELREKFVCNLQNEEYDTSKEMQKLYDFIESET